MSTTLPSTIVLPAPVLPTAWSLADLHQRLGGIPLERIRLYPPPGMATADDVVQAHDRDGRLCELIDGVLVEKTMGSYESYLATRIIILLGVYVQENDLGIVLGPDGPLRVLPDQVRIPDVCFLSWDRFPNREFPREPIFNMAPDLAVEVLSSGNSPGEMQRKLADYFAGGTRLVWYIEPHSRSARAYTSPENVLAIDETGQLEGGEVLPGFTLKLADLFRRARDPS